MPQPTTKSDHHVTRIDVARLAGVSTAVVSYVVNDGPRKVAPRTRERVLRAIRELDYHPNPSARALKTGSTGLIGVVVPEILNSYFAEFVDAVDSAANSRGASILLGITHENASLEAGIIPSLISRGVDGIAFNCRLEDQRLYHSGDARIPRVLLDRATPVSDLPIVGSDLGAGARMATEHLADHGHRLIGFVGGPFPSPHSDFRLEAWKTSLSSRGLPVPRPAITSWDRDGGYRGARDLLARPNPPTAIFAASDLIGVGVLRAVHEAGLRIPEDVAVASLDGTAESAYSWPALTTARQPFEKMAGTAIDLLLSPAATPQRILFPMDLVVRSSCGCSEAPGAPAI